VHGNETVIHEHGFYGFNGFYLSTTIKTYL
jgi:hypothetical protein